MTSFPSPPPARDEKHLARIAPRRPRSVPPHSVERARAHRLEVSLPAARAFEELHDERAALAKDAGLLAPAAVAAVGIRTRRDRARPVPER
eukprot:29501-Pelagococcus_subviridis.AAC.4